MELALMVVLEVEELILVMQEVQETRLQQAPHKEMMVEVVVVVVEIMELAVAEV
jgi:hypothetical protein